MNSRYRRPLGAVNGYTAASFAQDIVQIAAVVPEAVSVGGNTGQVNSFAGVDLGNITGGVYQTSDLTNPTRFVCFFYQLTLAIVPDFLRSEALGTALAGALNLLQTQISPLVDPSCPEIGELILRGSTHEKLRYADMQSSSKLQRRICRTIPGCCCWSALRGVLVGSNTA